MRKMIVLLMVACVAAVGFAGGATEETGTAGTAAGNLTPVGTFPIVEEPTTIGIYTFGQPNEDPSDNWFTQYYEEKTNVRVDWEITPADQYKEKMNLRFASRDYPDIIAAANNHATRLTKDEEIRYGVQGIFRPLNELIQSQSVWYRQALEELPGLQEFNTTPDGNIYAFVQINDCFHCAHMQKMFVNTDWLDRLGLDIPETPEEFKEMLIAFRDEDANGNGDPADEIPLSTDKSGLLTALDGFLMCPFQYTSTSEFDSRLYIDDGTVVASFVQPGYQEGLRYLNSLWEEGLIYPESFTQDVATQRNMNESGDVRVLGAVAGAHHGFFATAGGGNWREYEAIKPLKGPAGQLTINEAYKAFRSGGGAITTGCEQPEVAMRLLDWLYSEEGAILAGYGGKGITWDDAPEGSVGLDGRPAKRIHLTLDEDDEWFNKAAWGLAIPSNISRDVRVSWAAPTDWHEEHSGAVEKYLYDMTAENYAPYAVPYEMVLPPMYYDESVIQEMAMLKTGIMDYVSESVAQFVVGKRDVDSDWVRYLRELESIGVNRYLEIIQAAYDEQFK